MSPSDVDRTDDPMRRRFLASAGGAVGVLLAGCVADGGNGANNGSPDGDDGTDDSDDGTDGDEPTEGFPSDGGGDPPTSTAGEDSPDSCPADDHVENAVCYDSADIDEVDGFLEPPETAVAVGEPAEFTLHNESDRILETDFHNWAVHKYVHNEWHYVERQGVNDTLTKIARDATYTWTVTVDNEAVLDGRSAVGRSDTDDFPLHGLGGGHYAFGGRAWFEDESYEDATGFAGTFELDADPIPLVSTDAVESTEFEDDALVVETSRGDPDEHRLAAYELEHVDGQADERLIVEQIYHDDRLRDALALAYENGADRVRLEEYTHSHSPFSTSFEGRFTFQGETFEVTTEELD